MRRPATLPPLAYVLAVSLLAATLASAAGAAEAPAAAARPLKVARFLGEPASAPATQVADWIVASRDNRGASFVIVDKVAAKVFVFDAAGQLRGASPALLGLAHGD